MSSLEDEMQFLTCTLIFSIKEYCVIMPTIRWKELLFFQDLLLLKDGDLKTFIHHALLYSSYQVIVGNTHKTLSLFEKAGNYNTEGLHGEYIFRKMYFLI